jgi:hypothetical protein
MKIVFRIIGCLLVLAGALAAQAQPQPLFNGRDLTGWVVMHGGQWTVEEGVLVGRNELEYAVNERGNSGVHFRSRTDKNPSFTGYEMQIVDDHGKEARKTGTGSIYDVVAPRKNMSKPAGEWNQARITCQGKRIQITLNGETVVDHESDRSAKGYIGLQNHDAHAVIKFRNLRIMEK